MKRNILLILISLIFYKPYAIRPAQVIHSFKITLSSQQDIPVLGYAVLKLDLVKGKNYKKKEFEGSQEGVRFWKRLIVRSSNGYVRDGLLFPDFNSLSDSGIIILSVKSKYYRGKEKTFSIKIPVLKQIEILPERNEGYGIGSILHFKVIGTYSNDESYELSESSDYYGFKKEDFRFMVNKENISNFSTILPEMNSLDRHINISAIHKTRNLSCHYHLLMDYKIAYYSAFAGSKGINGWNGNNPSSSKGRNGENGTNGTNGGDGEDGKTLMVYAGVFKIDSISVVRLKIKIDQNYHYYTLNCDGGELKLLSQGGEGGNGGNGGDGANAYTRNSTETVYGGNGGNGGNGGKGGRGGRFVIYTDSASMDCVQQVLKLLNPGGSAGQGGKRGGKGFGEGPDKNNQSLLSVLLGTGSYNGYKGANGHDGYQGESGMAASWELISRNELDNILNFETAK